MSLFLTEKPSRRGFLRSLAVAPAAGLATHKLILPANALVAPDDAASRLAHHLAGAEAAFAELYPHGEILRWGNNNGRRDPDLKGSFVRGEISGDFVLHFSTMEPTPVHENLRELAEKFARERGF